MSPENRVSEPVGWVMSPLAFRVEREVLVFRI
jgi:hypothetical protein